MPEVPTAQCHAKIVCIARRNQNPILKQMRRSPRSPRSIDLIGHFDVKSCIGTNCVRAIHARWKKGLFFHEGQNPYQADHSFLKVSIVAPLVLSASRPLLLPMFFHEGFLSHCATSAWPAGRPAAPQAPKVSQQDS